MYCQKDERVPNMFHLLFVDSKLSNGYVSWTSYLQRILDSLPRKTLIAKAMSLQNAFKMQFYFHVLMSFEECMLTKLVFTVSNCNSNMQLG